MDLAAARILALVSALCPGRLRSARLTVALETPTLSAMAWMLALLERAMVEQEDA